MEDATKIYEKGDITIFRRRGFTKEIIDFLDNTVWGTEETLYEHLETAKRVKNIKNPKLMILRKEGELAAMVVFIERAPHFKDKQFKAYFTRYLAATQAIRGTGLVARASALVMKMVREDETEPSIFYASVEAKNKSSLRVVKSVDYEQISRIKTVGFNRFFPKKNKHVQRLVSPEQQVEMHQKLRAFYIDYGFYSSDHLFIDDNYFVYRENGEILAGLQAHKALWVISSLPGKMGQFLIKWAPRLPLIRRVVNPKKFEFIALEGIYYKKGHLNKFFRLIEHVLTEFSVYSALFWFDERSPHYLEIESSKKLGYLNQFVKDSDTYTMASFENMSPADIQLVKELPVYVSSYDFI